MGCPPIKVCSKCGRNENVWAKRGCDGATCHPHTEKEDHKLKVILDYIAISKSAWPTGDLISKRGVGMGWGLKGKRWLWFSKWGGMFDVTLIHSVANILCLLISRNAPWRRHCVPKRTQVSSVREVPTESILPCFPAPSSKKRMGVCAWRKTNLTKMMSYPKVWFGIWFEFVPQSSWPISSW